MREKTPEFNSGPEALQWKRLKRLNLEGARLEYLTKITIFDRFFAATLLKILPRSISPNRITLFRFISIPFVLYLLIAGFQISGTVLFILSALSDALDGARARTDHRITKLGILMDPAADKLLIGSVAIFVIIKHVGIGMAAAIVLIELALISSAYFRYSGKLMPAKTVGKMKMIFECFGTGFVLLYSIIGAPILLTIGTAILYLAIVFGLASLIIYRSI